MQMKLSRRTFILSVALICILGITAAAQMFSLRNFAPTNKTVTTASAELLAADSTVRTVQLSNVGVYDVWYCHKSQTAVLNKGFYLPAGSSVTLSGNACPLEGLNAIADGGSTTVAIGKG